MRLPIITIEKLAEFMAANYVPAHDNELVQGYTNRLRFYKIC